MKLEVRYTKDDPSVWIGLVFSALFIGWGFLEMTVGVVSPEPSAVWGGMVTGWGVWWLITPLREMYDSRIGKLHCVIDETGMHWYGRVWYRLWGWGKITTMPWSAVSQIKIDETSTSVSLYPLQTLIYIVRCVLNTDAGGINHDNTNKTPAEVRAAIALHAPHLETSDLILRAEKT